MRPMDLGICPDRFFSMGALGFVLVVAIPGLNVAAGTANVGRKPGNCLLKQTPMWMEIQIPIPWSSSGSGQWPCSRPRLKCQSDDTGGKNAETKAAVAPIVGEVDVRGKAGIGKAFIGGGCCVHLSIEYTPTNAASTAPALVMVVVQDSEKTTLGWMKQAEPQDGYVIKEAIITTKPGAHLTVLVVNMTARVRWCEVFSC